MRLAWRVAVLAPFLILLGGGDDGVQIKLHLRYADRPYDALGFGADQWRPIRYATVELVPPGARRGWVGHSDSEGNATVSMPEKYSNNFEMRIHPHARTGPYDILVWSPTRSVARVSTFTASSKGDQDIDVDVVDDRFGMNAAPFNALDVAINAMDYIRSIEPLANETPQRLDIELLPVPLA